MSEEVNDMPDPAEQTGGTIRVFLLDDHEVVRRGVRELLESTDDIRVVGEAADGDEALRRVPATKPDVAILDVRLGEGNGIEVCRELRAAHADLVCLMLTSFDDDEALFDAIVAGASGYILKEVRGTALIDAVRRAAAGESLLDPIAAARVIERLRNPRPTDDRLSSLSQQEQRILALLAEGMTNRQISERMYLAEKTIKNYVSNLLLKLGMSRRTEAAVYAARIAERAKAGPRA